MLRVLLTQSKHIFCTYLPLLCAATSFGKAPRPCCRAPSSYSLSGECVTWLLILAATVRDQRSISQGNQTSLRHVWGRSSMKLKRLRLIGFKSFVEPADFLIEPGLTGVVGPNGCGKSNLVEA